MPHSSTKGRFLEKCLKSDKVRDENETLFLVGVHQTGDVFEQVGKVGKVGKDGRGEERE